MVIRQISFPCAASITDVCKSHGQH